MLTTFGIYSNAPHCYLMTNAWGDPLNISKANHFVHITYLGIHALVYPSKALKGSAKADSRSYSRNPIRNRNQYSPIYRLVVVLFIVYS